MRLIAVMQVSPYIFTMTYVYALDVAQFLAKLKQTVLVSDCYHLQCAASNVKLFSIHIPSKAVVVSGRITAVSNGTELSIRAASPICVISTDFEQKILTKLLSDLEKSLQQPARLRTATNKPHFLGFFQKPSARKDNESTRA